MSRHIDAVRRWSAVGTWTAVCLLCSTATGAQAHLASAATAIAAAELNDAAAAFQAAARDHQQEARSAMVALIAARIRRIHAVSRPATESARAAARALRQAAIARLEAFVHRHPNQPRATPDALFRLAALYQEADEDRHIRAEAEHDRRTDLYERGKRLDPPRHIDLKVDRSIAIWQRLQPRRVGERLLPLPTRIARPLGDRHWADFAHSDAAAYLQGVAESEMGREQAAIATLSWLGEQRGNSTYAAEAWLRVGEMRFDAGQFESAAAAYAKALARKDPRWSSLALYKLGWSNFQMYRYPQAVRWFSRLIDSASTRRRTHGRTADLRREALQYLARSLAEAGWDRDGCADFGGEQTRQDCPQLDPALRAVLYTSAVMPVSTDLPAGWIASVSPAHRAAVAAALATRQAVRRQLGAARPWLREALVEYATSLLELAEEDTYRQAARVLDYVVGRWPDSRDAEVQQRRLVHTLDLLAEEASSWALAVKRQPQDAHAQAALKLARHAGIQRGQARRQWLSRFGPHSRWLANRNADRDLVGRVTLAAGEMRGQLAALQHRRAQELRAAGRGSEARTAYLAAVDWYDRLLASEATSSRRTAWRMARADALYFGSARCDGVRNQQGRLALGDDGVPAAHSPAAIDAVLQACATLDKAAAAYSGLAGPNPDGTDAGPRSREAALGRIASLSRLLAAEATIGLGKNSVQRMGKPTMVPELRPSDDEDDEAIVAAEAGRPQPASPLSPMAKRWLAAVDRWVDRRKVAPQDIARQRAMALQAAELLYRNRLFEPFELNAASADADNRPAPGPSTAAPGARARLANIIRRWPRTEEAFEAARDLLTSYRIAGDLGGTRRVAEQILEQGWLPPERVEATRELLAEIIASDASRRANRLLDAVQKARTLALAQATPKERRQRLVTLRQRREAAASGYGELAKLASTSQLRATALTNRAVLLCDAERWQRCLSALSDAEAAARQLVAEAPKAAAATARLVVVLQRRAQVHLGLLQIPQAIAALVAVVDSGGDRNSRADALFDAVRLAWQSEAWQQVIDLGRRAVAEFDDLANRRDQLRDVSWWVVLACDKKGDSAAYSRAAREFIGRYTKDETARPRVMRARLGLARRHASAGDQRLAATWWKRVVAEFARSGDKRDGGPVATAAAEAGFRLLEPQWKRFMATGLVMSSRGSARVRMADLQRQMKRMIEVALGRPKWRRQANGQRVRVRSGGLYLRYKKEVADYGARDWWYAASLYRARILLHVARTLYSAPMPDDLPQHIQDQAIKAVERFARRFEDRALALLQRAHKHASTRAVVNRWVVDIARELHGYFPDRYPRMRLAPNRVVEPPGVAPGAEKTRR